MKLGLSGLLTRTFINSPLTPLLLLAAIVAGALALASLPREEEPQISVPMVDIIVQANGYKADQAVELVTRPLEDIIKGIDGVEHVYSQTEDDRVVVTARFLVGTDQDTAITRVHEKIRAHIGELPKGIPEPLIVGRGINDVAIVDLTLSARPDHAGQSSVAKSVELCVRSVARPLPGLLTYMSRFPLASLMNSSREPSGDQSMRASSLPVA